MAEAGGACCRYLQGLFALAHDTSTEVRKAVCTGLVQMLQLQPELLAPHMHDIIEYMLASTQVSSPSPQLACRLRGLGKLGCSRCFDKSLCLCSFVWSWQDLTNKLDYLCRVA